jgi:8-amino-7-oxononanoate synthase
MMVRAVVPPTVAEGTSRVRVCLHAGNTSEDIGKLVHSLETWCTLMKRRLEIDGEYAERRELIVSARL